MPRLGGTTCVSSTTGTRPEVVVSRGDDEPTVAIVRDGNELVVTTTKTVTTTERIAVGDLRYLHCLLLEALPYGE
jgi:hypothetical protein